MPHIHGTVKRLCRNNMETHRNALIIFHWHGEKAFRGYNIRGENCGMCTTYTSIGPERRNRAEQGKMCHAKRQFELRRMGTSISNAYSSHTQQPTLFKIASWILYAIHIDITYLIYYLGYTCLKSMENSPLVSHSLCVSSSIHFKFVYSQTLRFLKKMYRIVRISFL